MKKRGLSPVIASVLLVALVVVLAAIIFIWARGFVSEGVGKFGKPADRACGDVFFEAGIYPATLRGESQYDLEINNQGEIPLYGFDIKKFGIGEVIVTEYVSAQGGNAVGTGQSVSLDLDGDLYNIQSGSQYLIVPIILGETNSGRVAYTCGDQYGVGVSV